MHLSEVNFPQPDVIPNGKIINSSGIKSVQNRNKSLQTGIKNT